MLRGHDHKECTHYQQVLSRQWPAEKGVSLPALWVRENDPQLLLWMLAQAGWSGEPELRFLAARAASDVVKLVGIGTEARPVLDLVEGCFVGQVEPRELKEGKEAFVLKGFPLFSATDPLARAKQAALSVVCWAGEECAWEAACASTGGLEAAVRLHVLAGHFREGGRSASAVACEVWKSFASVISSLIREAFSNPFHTLLPVDEGKNSFPDDIACRLTSLLSAETTPDFS